MVKIVHARAFMLDLVPPQVERTDAIQSFKSQETIFVQLEDAEGGAWHGL